eukprot:gene32972-55533_t
MTGVSCSSGFWAIRSCGSWRTETRTFLRRRRWSFHAPRARGTSQPLAETAMSADLKSLFPGTPALKSVLRPEDLGAETLARHLPWLSARADDLILTRQGDLIASAVVNGLDSFTVEEGEISLVPASLARLIGQLGEGFGFHVSKLTLPDWPQFKGFDADLDAKGVVDADAFAAAVDRRWQAHLVSRDLKRRVLMVSVILRPTALKRLPLMGALFKAAFTDDLGAR